MGDRATLRTMEQIRASIMDAHEQRLRKTVPEYRGEFFDTNSSEWSLATIIATEMVRERDAILGEMRREIVAAGAYGDFVRDEPTAAPSQAGSLQITPRSDANPYDGAFVTLTSTPSDARAEHRAIVKRALDAARDALRSARLHERRTDCAVAAVQALEGQLRCVECEDEQGRAAAREEDRRTR